MSDHSSHGQQAPGRERHLLLGASGSVATIKLPEIVKALSRWHPRLKVRVILTKSAQKFLAGQSREQPRWEESLRAQSNVEGVFVDEHEWREPWMRGFSVLHIELRKWADLFVIAPLSANTMAKIAGGWADNLLTSVARAWDTTGILGSGDTTEVKRRKIVLAPAMNTAMWNHPVTAKHLAVLEGEWGIGKPGGWIEVLRPVEKELVCGDTGDGAMKDWREITDFIVRDLGLV